MISLLDLNNYTTENNIGQEEKKNWNKWSVLCTIFKKYDISNMKMKEKGKLFFSKFDL